MKNVGWEYKLIGGSPFENRGTYFITKLRYKINRLFQTYFGNSLLFAERSHARCYDELLNDAKKIKADWYIGHTLGALAVAVKAAKHHQAKAGFDFEDYHRGENNPASSQELNKINYLENKYVPQLHYISAASPMIAQKIADHFPKQQEIIITLLNCFPLSQQPAFRKKARADKTLQLFWFSQTIGLNRGLEILIEALVQLNDPSIHLTLAGRCNPNFSKYIQKNAGPIKDQIHFAGIIPPNELPSFAAKFDVGLALEPGFSINNNIALSNKIFTCLLAGNAILLSETPMQRAFNKEYAIGQSFELGNSAQLKEILVRYKDPEILDRQRKYNYNIVKVQFNWDIESKKLINCISEN